jgi:hypothetical protein
LLRIGPAYARATVSLHRPPANREELVPFLGRNGSEETFLRSPNDGEDFVIIWDVDIRKLPIGGKDLPVIAYEKRGQDGKRYVLRGRTDVVQLTDAELRSAVLPPGHPLP